jgi:cystathionine gamma-lyase
VAGSDGITPVGGEHAITGTLPTIADVVAFKEHTAFFGSGYYRFVPHPFLRQIADSLQTRFGCRHCRLAESPEAALRELLLCLHTPSTPQRLIVDADKAGASPVRDLEFFPPWHRHGLSVEPADSATARNDILLLVVNASGPILAEAPRRARDAHERGATVIVMCPGAGGEVPAIPDAQYWIVSLSSRQPGVRGGAILGSSDRVMAKLTEQMKRHGALLSSRDAGCILGVEEPAAAAAGARERVAAALCRMEGGTRAFLYASGMSAVTHVLHALRRPGASQIISVGHLYSDSVDLLRFAPRRPEEAENISIGVHEVPALEGLISDQTAAVLTETITNPLNDVPDLPAIARITRARGIPLVVDNTLATPLNCTPLAWGADFVIHSTTKFLNGSNDHGGGAVIIRNAQLAQLLEQGFQQWDSGMSPLEAAVLEGHMEDFPRRMGRFNANAVRIASLLEGHPGVGRLFFNGISSHPSFTTAQKILTGPGSVVSFSLADDSMEGLRAFYDPPLPHILKAPSLGSDVTLLCPYTLLTHYEEPDEVLESLGLSRYIVRVAVGCEEDLGPVTESLDAALRNPR